MTARHVKSLALTQRERQAGRFLLVQDSTALAASRTKVAWAALIVTIPHCRPVTLVNSCSWFSQVARGGSSAALEQSTSPSHT